LTSDHRETSLTEEKVMETSRALLLLCRLEDLAYHPWMLSISLLIVNLFVWLWLVVNDRKFSARTVFFSHTNQPTVFFYEPTTIRISQTNRMYVVEFLPKI